MLAMPFCLSGSTHFCGQKVLWWKVEDVCDDVSHRTRFLIEGTFQDLSCFLPRFSWAKSSFTAGVVLAKLGNLWRTTVTLF
jgi:hypothetical protein